MLNQCRTPPGDVQKIGVALLRFSTGRSHPQARRPKIFVTESQGMDPDISIAISGDTLALIITQDRPRPEDHIYIFDWKAGVLMMVSEFHAHTAS